ncbi:hypothetical protein [Williamsia sp. M5A3_1d]
MSDLVSGLRKSGGNGTFASGQAVGAALSTLGDVASQMSDRLNSAIEEYNKAIIAAGGLITQQESDNARSIGAAGSSDKPSSIPLPFGASSALPGSTPTVIPNGPSLADQMQSTFYDLPPVPSGSPDAAGRFPCGAAPEGTGGLTLDICQANLSPADAGYLQRLAQQWQQLGADLTDAVTAFHQIVQSKMAAGGWTGTSGPAVGAAAHKLVNTSVEISAEAAANGGAIVAWAGALGTTKTAIEQITGSRTAAMATTPPEAMIATQNQFDTLARTTIDTIYNPGVTAIASGLSNLTDPASPVTGVAIGVGGATGQGGGGATNPASGSTTGLTGSGGSGSSGAGGGSGPGGNRTGNDAAGTLSRQATGDPAANAAKTAANQTGQGGQNPASAAQSAMSKAGDSAKSLGGNSGSGSPLTRSAGLGGLSDAEKAAKAAALGKAGGGAGGGGSASGGGGAGKLGGIGAGAGAAAAEGSLSARSSGSALTAAERALAGQQAAPATGRAGAMSPGMGGRGAGNKEEDKEHTVARYLITAEHGDEIAGELPDVAPDVIGGLNLDTTDNPPTP